MNTPRSIDRPPLRIGLFGIGLDVYWPQFAGLKERLEGYLRRVADKLQTPGVEVVNLGLIDTPAKASDAGHRFRQADVDLMFLYATTYALTRKGSGLFLRSSTWTASAFQVQPHGAAALPRFHAERTTAADASPQSLQLRLGLRLVASCQPVPR